MIRLYSVTCESRYTLPCMGRSRCIHRYKREQLYRPCPHLLHLRLKAPSVGSCPFSASDIIIPGRIWGLNQRAACVICAVGGALYETDLHETPGDSHYSPAAYQTLNPRNNPPEERVVLLTAPLRPQVPGRWERETWLMPSGWLQS